MKKIITSAVLLYSALSVHADVTLHGLFTDNMILQRDIPVAVYGMAEPGEKVTVAFGGSNKSATADKDGILLNFFVRDKTFAETHCLTHEKVIHRWQSDKKDVKF